MVAGFHQTQVFSRRQYVSDEFGKAADIRRSDERGPVVRLNQFFKCTDPVARNRWERLLGEPENLAPPLSWKPVVEDADLFLVPNISLQNDVGLHLRQVLIGLRGCEYEFESGATLSHVRLEDERAADSLLLADSFKALEPLRRFTGSDQI